MPTDKKQAVLAFSYLRFSTKRQALGDSQRRQTELAEGYCRRRGWTLSEKTFEDLGVSAFKGKNALVGNLGEFLKAVQSGAVPPGSALIVESLDRITRQGIDEGYDLVKRILKAGVLLVTLAPEREFDASATKSLSKGALEIQLILERAAEESERKSERIAAAWAAKRKKAREGGNTIVAGSLPAWVGKRDSRLALIPERAQAVKRIFELAAAGYGRSRIVQALKAEGIPSFSGKEAWPSCTIGFILTDRRALGEYQPCKKGRVKAGEAIRDYYPPAVTEREWLAARVGMSQRQRAYRQDPRPWTEEEDDLVRRLPVSTAARRTKRSRAAVYQRRLKLGVAKPQGRAKGSTNFINVFRGLIYDARPPHGTFLVVTRNEVRGPTKALLNSAHAEGKAPCRLFPLKPFERAVFKMLRELGPRDVLPEGGDALPDPVADLEAELNAVEVELAGAAAYMEAHGFSAPIGKRVTSLENRKAELGARLLDARAQAARPAAEAWGECRTLLDALDKAPDPADARLRLRAALRRVADEIWLFIAPRGRDRIAHVEVVFKGGKVHRKFGILYRPPRANQRGRQPGFWWTCSFRRPKEESIRRLLELEGKARQEALALFEGELVRVVLGLYEKDKRCREALAAAAAAKGIDLDAEGKNPLDLVTASGVIE